MGRFSSVVGRFGYLYKCGVRSRIPRRACYTRPVDCPELGEQVSFVTCLRCDKHRIWDPKDEIKRCYWEYKDLKSRGFYDGTWDDHPENFDSETFQRIQEQKRLYQSINQEMEQERTELQSRAEELQKEDSARQDEFGEEALGSFEQFFSEVHETWEEMERPLEERQGGNPDTIVTAVNIEPESHQGAGEHQPDEQTMDTENEEDNSDEYDEYEEEEEKDDFI